MSGIDLSNLNKLDKFQKKRSKYPLEDWPKRYKPIRVLGKGHDGMCYLCEDLERAELVAVKVLNPKRNRKITEPLLMRGLNHKHLIRMRDHFLLRGFNFLVIDYCEKGDLCDYVYENEYLEEDEARKIMLQLVKGVRYLHDRGICHRDLKLDNIFIDKDFNIRIGDFGASCLFDQETKLTYRCGTTQYNAPELVKNQGYFGDEVDCWALGIILYVMLIGKFPFDCDTDMQLLWQVLKGIKFPERPALSSNAKDLIRSLTEPQPSQRATLPAILEHVWMQPAIKADPNFEKDEEEAALAAQQSRSARNSDAGLSAGSEGGAASTGGAGGGGDGDGNNDDDAADDDANDERRSGKEPAATVEPAAPAAPQLVGDKDVNGI